MGCAFKILLAPVEATEKIVEGTVIGVETIGETITAASEIPSDPSAVGRVIAAPALGTARVLEKTAQTIEAGVAIPLAAGAEIVMTTAEAARPRLRTHGSARAYGTPGTYRSSRPYRYRAYRNLEALRLRELHRERMRAHRERIGHGRSY